MTAAARRKALSGQPQGFGPGYPLLNYGNRNETIIFSLAFVATLSMVIFVGYGSAKEMEYNGSGSSWMHMWIHVGKIIEIGEENFTIEISDWGQGWCTRQISRR